MFHLRNGSTLLECNAVLLQDLEFVCSFTIQHIYQRTHYSFSASWCPHLHQ